MLSTYEAIKLKVELFDRERKITHLALDKCDLEKEINKLSIETDECELKLSKQKIVSIALGLYSVTVSVALYIAI